MTEGTIYKAFYAVNSATIQSGMDEKTLRAVRKALNDLVDTIIKMATDAEATADDGLDK